MDHHPAHDALTGDDPASAPTRRRVLSLAAVTGLGGAVLAACGGGDEPAATTSTSSSPPASPESSPESSPSEAGSSPAAGGGLVATADVPVGGGVILEQKKIVVTQPDKGTFKAFTAVCTHMNCTVASVRKGLISCPCHGSGFDAADGSVRNGPATGPLREIPVAVEGDQVVEA